MKLSVEEGFRLHQALVHERYRVHAHPKFFPYDRLNEDGSKTTIHYAIDQGARAVYCSQEFHDTLTQVKTA